MIVRDVAVGGGSDGSTVLSARVQARDLDFPLEYAFRGVPPEAIPVSGDPFVPALLLSAMSIGEDLTIEAPVSRRLLEGAATTMEIYRAWEQPMRDFGDWSKGKLHRIRLIAPVASAGAENERVGQFFTCGVDAFYTLLKRNAGDGRHERVTDLILVNGLDPLENDPLFERIAANSRRVGREIGAEIIEVKTNLRRLVEPLADYSFSQGGLLIGVGLALGGWLRTCVIASGNAYQILRPWGTHPLLDPLWSTEKIEVVHDGCEALRIEKIRGTIAGSQLALDTLRVCTASLGGSRGDDYNCGRCGKCLRSMIFLDLAGALDRCATLPPIHDLKRAMRRGLVSMEVPDSTMMQLRSALEDSARGREYQREIRSGLRWHRLRKFALERPVLRTLGKPFGKLWR